MQQSRFLVLTGHLNDYPLSDLVGILRHQHKTGRLLIEYPNGPASFFFKEGELIDAQLDKLTGLQALCVAQAQPPSSFNFNPLIKPTRRSIDRSSQRAVSELLGCWFENDIEIEELPPAPPPPAALPSVSVTSAVGDLVIRGDESLMNAPLSLPPANNYSHLILGMAGAGLLLLGLSTVIAVTGGLGTQPSPQPALTTELKTPRDSNLPQIASGALVSPQPEIQEPTEATMCRPFVKGTTKAPQYSPPKASQDSTAAQTLSSTSPELSTVNQKKVEDVRQDAQRSGSDTQAVKVVLQIESGRVTRASIANHRPGMEAYEAMALRIARQRRYPAAETTQETVTIKVTQPK